MRKVINFVAFFILSSCGQIRSKNDLHAFQPKEVKSEIEIIEKSDKYQFDTCIGSFDNNTLYLEFQTKKVLASPYDLKMEISNDSVSVKSTMTYGVTDSSFRPTILTLISKTIIFDNNPLEKDKITSGNIDLSFSAYHSWGDIYTDTVNMKGFFEVYIQ